MLIKNTKIQKYISLLVIITLLTPSLIFLSTPKEANAEIPTVTPISDAIAAVKVAPTVTTATSGVATAGTSASGLGISTKTWYGQILDQLLMAIAKKALQTITKSVISWINSGFHGSPLFLENPQSFFTDIAKTEIKTLVNMFGYDPNMFPFGKAWALNTISSYKNTLAQNASYSMNSFMTATQATNFRNNFNVGGWNGFLINTQYPQNNYLGFNMMATNELAQKLQGYSQTAAQQVKTTLQQGQGFLSPQTCSTNPNYNNMTNEFKKPEYTSSAVFDPPYVSGGGLNSEDDNIPTDPGEQVIYDRYVATYNANRAAEKAAFDSPTGSTNCPKKADGSSGLINTTPGSVVSNQIMGSLSAGKDATVLGTALGTGLSAIFDALLNHFLDKGLNALASTVNPTPTADTWTYAGQSLNVNGTSSSIWNGADEEIILNKFKKQISGETDWTAVEGETISEAGDTRIGTCSNLKDSIGTCSNLKDSNGNLLPVSKAKCDTSKGTWTGNLLPDITSIPLAQCNVKKGTWVQDVDGKTYHTATTTTPPAPAHTDRIAVAGETISEVGDTRTGTCSTVTDSSVTKTICDKKSGDWVDDGTKTYVPGDIAKTQEEIALLNNYNPDPTQNRPDGVIQLLKKIPIEAQTLDQCLPGPDAGWEKRLDNEKDMVSRPITNQNNTSQDELKQRAANGVAKELNFAVTSFKDWVNTKMMASLPHAVLDMDAIKSLGDLYQQSTDATNSLHTKMKALAMLTVIQTSLDPIKSQPDPGSADEKIMINMKKQYNAVQADISSTNTIESTRAQLVTLNKQLENIINLDAVCEGGNMVSIDANGKQTDVEKGFIGWQSSERYQAGWGEVDKKNSVDRYGKGLSVNIGNVDNNIKSLKGITFSLTRSTMDITSHENIFLDVVTAGLSALFSGNSWDVKSTTKTINYTTTGTELEQFCSLPIATGYSHGDVIRSDSSNGNYGGSGKYPLGAPSPYTFRNLDNKDGIVVPAGATGKNIILDYTGLPMVNAQEVFGDINCTGPCSTGLGGFLGSPSNDTVSIDISCSAIWKANPLDYSHAGDLTQ